MKLKSQEKSPSAKLPLSHPSVTEALCAAGRNDFLTFVQTIFPVLSPGDQLAMNWHLEAIAYRLELMMHGKRKRQMILMPPRHLKSIIVSVAWPAYLLGKDPTKRIIVVSYGNELAVKHSNDFRAVIESDIYRRIFPNVRISSRKNTENEIETTERGFRLATSIDGTLTGRGADVVVIDDPLKPGEALSEARREKVIRWYSQTLLSRVNNPQTAAFVLVMQRLHQDDLAGHLIRQSKDWKVLKIRAIALADHQVMIGPNRYYHRKADEPLHPERFPLAELERTRQEVGSDTWNAQYQQAPVPAGGLMIKRAWVQRYDVLPPRKPGARIVQSIDTAIKAGPANDYSVITTWLFQDNCYWLIDVARKRLEYPGLKAWVIANAQKHKPNKILIEDAGTGSALIQELKYSAYSVVGVTPTTDKLTRMQIEAAKFESGKVYLPKSASWLSELEAELFLFPQSKHDDQVDSISQALAEKLYSYDPGVIADGLAEIFFSRPSFHVVY